jgi:tRNA A-37 threonylcarbamoyl transferase component Bud32
MSKTIKLKHHNIYWHLKPETVETTKSWLIDNFPSIYESENNILKNDTGSLVVQENDIVLKKRTLRPNKKRWQFAFRPSQSKRIYNITQTLTTLNIPVAPTLGYATEYKNGERKADYLLSSYIPGNIEFQDILSGKYKDLSLNVAIKKVAKLIATFHITGISNRDLKDSNIILDLTTNEFLAIDYDGISLRKNISKKRAQKDIIPIFISMRSHKRQRTSFELLISEYNAHMPAEKKLQKSIVDDFLK